MMYPDAEVTNSDVAETSQHLYRALFRERFRH